MIRSGINLHDICRESGLLITAIRIPQNRLYLWVAICTFDFEQILIEILLFMRCTKIIIIIPNLSQCFALHSTNYFQIQRTLTDLPKPSQHSQGMSYHPHVT